MGHWNLRSSRPGPVHDRCPPPGVPSEYPGSHDRLKAGGAWGVAGQYQSPIHFLPKWIPCTDFLIHYGGCWLKRKREKISQQVTVTFQSPAISKLPLKLNCNLFIQEFIVLKNSTSFPTVVTLIFFAFLAKCFKISWHLKESIQWSVMESQRQVAGWLPMQISFHPSCFSKCL